MLVNMVVLAQLVRASACGAEGCRFKSGTSPQHILASVFDVLKG